MPNQFRFVKAAKNAADDITGTIGIYLTRNRIE